jgi:hypothetical protein
MVKDRHVHASLLSQSLDARGEAYEDILLTAEGLTDQVNEERK